MPRIRAMAEAGSTRAEVALALGGVALSTLRRWCRAADPPVKWRISSGGDGAAGPPPERTPPPPPLPLPETPAEVRALLRRIGTDRRLATAHMVQALRASLLGAEADEAASASARGMKRRRLAPLPTTCQHCGKPISYGRGRPKGTR